MATRSTSSGNTTTGIDSEFLGKRREICFRSDDIDFLPAAQIFRLHMIRRPVEVSNAILYGLDIRCTLPRLVMIIFLT